MCNRLLTINSDNEFFSQLCPSEIDTYFINSSVFISDVCDGEISSLSFDLQSVSEYRNIVCKKCFPPSF